MAPEVLSSAVVPASDIWSAGVMAHQLLTGRFPFDDKTNPGRPAISKIWYVLKPFATNRLLNKFEDTRLYLSRHSDNGCMSGVESSVNISYRTDHACFVLAHGSAFQ